MSIGRILAYLGITAVAYILLMLISMLFIIEVGMGKVEPREFLAEAFVISSWIVLGIWVVVALNLFIKNRDDD